MEPWKIARDKGNDIAQKLGLRKSSDLVEHDYKAKFERELAKLADTPDAPAFRRLHDIYIKNTRRRRNLETAVALLEQAWRVAPHTTLAEDVVRIITHCYHEDPRSNWHLLIRDELRDRQMHPFPSVRWVVHQVRRDDRAEEAELDELASTQRGYPDVRQSIAQRIIEHRQFDHLEILLDYLSAMQNSSADMDKDLREEVKTAQQLAKELVSQLTSGRFNNDETLDRLYSLYLDDSKSKEWRSLALRVLTACGDAIVFRLEDDYEDQPEKREHIERLLSWLVGAGNSNATKVLLKAIQNAAPNNLGRLRKSLENALDNLSKQKHILLGAMAVRDALVDSLPMLESRNISVAEYLDRFDNPDWKYASIEPLINRVLTSALTDAQRHQLKSMGGSVAKRLLEIAEDTGLTPAQRRRALDELAFWRIAATPQNGRRLWAIFARKDEVDEVRIGILKILAKFELHPGEDARTVLSGLTKVGSDALAKAIDGAWNSMFPPPFAHDSPSSK